MKKSRGKLVLVKIKVMNEYKRIICLITDIFGEIQEKIFDRFIKSLYRPFN